MREHSILTIEDALICRGCHSRLWYKDIHGNPRLIENDNSELKDICIQWDDVVKQREQLDIKVKELDIKLERIANKKIPKYDFSE